MEPYQNVRGCSAAPPNPNGALADATNCVLSHELIESITDPDLDAWIANNSLLTSRAEIGDLCQPIGNKGQALDSYVMLYGHPYEIQAGVRQHVPRLRWRSVEALSLCCADRR